MAEKKKPDLSEFFAKSQPKKPPCKVGFVLDQLDGEEKEQLEAALGYENNVITGAAIAEWLKERNYDMVTAVSVSNHRRGICTCARS